MKKVIGWLIIITVVSAFIGFVLYSGGVKALFGILFLMIVMGLIISVILYAVDLIMND